MHQLIHILANACFIYYDPIEWVWLFADTVCGYIISTYTDCYTSLAVVSVIVFLDCITLLMLRKSVKMMKAQNQDTASSNCAIRRRRHTEVRFFWQTLCQNVMFFYELFNFYYICNFFEDQWPVFFTTTFAWEICHAMDG
ncbi:hypothetical protein COOONC_19931 [Cooperia oncophora]